MIFHLFLSSALLSALLQFAPTPSAYAHTHTIKGHCEQALINSGAASGAKSRADRFKELYWRKLTESHTSLTRALLPVAQNMLINESKTLSEHYAQNPPTVDVVIIGAGVHGAILNMALDPAITEHGLKVLNVDLAPYPGHDFIQAGESFKINSPEFGNGVSSNVLFGPVELQHLDRSLNKTNPYATAETLGAAILFTHASSHGGYILSDGVIELKPWVPTNTKPHRWTVTLQSGLKIHARHIVYAGGFTNSNGIDQTRSIDVIDNGGAYNVYTPDLNTELPLEWTGTGVISAQQFFNWVQDFKKASPNPHSVFDHISDVSIIGAGDTGNCLVEMLTAHRTRWRLPNLKWFGNPHSTFEQFKANNKPRYHAQMEHFYRNIVLDGSLEIIKEKLKSIHVTYRYYDKHYALITETGAHHSTRLVILAAGYNTSAPEYSVLSLLPQNHNLSLINASVRGTRGEVLAQKFMFTSQDAQRPRTTHARHNNFLIYSIGTAAGPITAPQELTSTITMNPQSINVLGPRTYEFGQQLLRRILGTPR